MTGVSRFERAYIGIFDMLHRLQGNGDDWGLLMQSGHWPVRSNQLPDHQLLPVVLGVKDALGLQMRACRESVISTIIRKILTVTHPDKLRDESSFRSWYCAAMIGKFCLQVKNFSGPGSVEADSVEYFPVPLYTEGYDPARYGGDEIPTRVTLFDASATELYFNFISHKSTQDEATVNNFRGATGGISQWLHIRYRSTGNAMLKAQSKSFFDFLDTNPDLDIGMPVGNFTGAGNGASITFTIRPIPQPADGQPQFTDNHSSTTHGCSTGQETYDHGQYTPNRFDRSSPSQTDLPERQRATKTEIERDRFAVVDHVPFKNCYGADGASFSECENVPWICRDHWAEAMGIVSEECADVLELEEGNRLHDNVELAIERRLKMFFVLPILIFRKVDPEKKIQHEVRKRLMLWKAGKWAKLIGDLEADIAKCQRQDYTHQQSPNSPDNVCRRRALELIRLGQMRRARQALTSSGCSDPQLPHIRDQMKAKFPVRKEAITEPTEEQLAYPRAHLDVEAFRKALLQLKPKTSPGLGCLRNEHLTALVYNKHAKASPNAKDAFNRLHRFCDVIVSGNLPQYFFEAWTATSLSALNKRDPSELAEGEVMDCRPVAKGNCLRKAVNKAFLQPFKDQIIQRTSPTQYGCSVEGGGTQLTTQIQLHLQHSPDHVLVSIDIKNAYNEIKRKRILDQLWGETLSDSHVGYEDFDEEAFRGMYIYLYKMLEVESYVGLGSGTRMVDAEFKSSEGVQQGATESSALFCIGLDKANRITNQELREKGGFLVSGMDDTYLVGPPDEVFAAVHRHKTRLADLGLVLAVHKSKCYLAAEQKDEIFHRQRGDIEEGYVEDSQGVRRFGLRVYGVPIGEDDFISSFLEDRIERFKEDFGEISRKLNPRASSAPEIPLRQCFWQLLLKGLQFRGNFLARHLPPRQTEAFCSSFDNLILKLVHQATGIDIETVSAFTKSRISLPITMKGIGIQSLVHKRNSEFLGGMVQGITPLVDTTTKEGLKKKGRLNIESIVTLPIPFMVIGNLILDLVKVIFSKSIPVA